MTNGMQARVKKSYSISVESEAYVRRYRKTRKIASDSEALDRLLLEALAAEKLSALGVAYKKYFDVASDEELQEDSAWAEVGYTALAEVEWKA